MSKVDKSKLKCNRPKRTPSHKTKSHTGKPKSGESSKQKARRASFKARHAKNIKKGKMSAAYWAYKVKW